MKFSADKCKVMHLGKDNLNCTGKKIRMLLRDNHLLCTEMEGTEKTIMGRDGESFLGKLLTTAHSNRTHPNSCSTAATEELRDQRLQASKA